MWAAIFRAIGRAFAGAAKYGWMIAEEIVVLPFRLLSWPWRYKAQQDAAAAVADAQAKALEEKNVALKQSLSSLPVARKTAEVAHLDKLENKAALVRRFAVSVVEDKPTPDISGLDMRTALWCEAMRHDTDAASAVRATSPAVLERHIGGIYTMPRLHPWPEDALVAEASAWRQMGHAIADECEAEETRRYG